VTLSLLIKAARECWKEFSAIVKAAELSGGREVFSEMGERIG
jgi:hypothetical protein